METCEGSGKRLGIIVAILQCKVDEARAGATEVGGGTGEAAFADIFGEIITCSERKKSAHYVGVGMHMRGELVIINSIVEILLNIGGDLIDGVINIHDLLWLGFWGIIP